jgi:hypothetical protein
MSTTAELASRNGEHGQDRRLYREAVKATMKKREPGPDGQSRRVDPTEAEVDQFLLAASIYRLEPLAGQIYAAWEGGVMKAVTTIDGFRLLAERTGKYHGQTAVEWCDGEGSWTDYWLAEDHPVAARVGVYKAGHAVPTIGTANWHDFAPTGNAGADSLWAAGEGKPAHMLSIRAEALALRKAFPAELSGLYTAEELGIHLAEDEPASTPDASPVPEAEGEGGAAPAPSVIVDPPSEQPSGAPALPQSRRTLEQTLECSEYAKLRADLTRTLFDQHPDRLTDEQAERLTAALREAEEAGITAVELERVCKVGLRHEEVEARSRALLEWISERRQKALAKAGESEGKREQPEAPNPAQREESAPTDAKRRPGAVETDPGPEPSP